MRILVCGNREWTCTHTIGAWIRFFGDGAYLRMCHGGNGIRGEFGAADRGADVIAADIAKSLGWYVDEYPADWQKHGKAAGPIRNQQMLDSGVDRCLAFGALYRGTKRTGTGDMVMRCNAAGVLATVVPKPMVLP